MADKTELRIDQIFGTKVLDSDGDAQFCLSDKQGNEVTITCRQNVLPSLISVLQDLYKEAYAKAHAKPLN